MRGVFAWLVLAGAFGQMACEVKRVQVGSPSVAVNLVGTEWFLVELDGRPVTAATVPTLLLSDDTRASGFAGCNRYTGSYEIAADRLAFGLLAMTRMACAETMDVEQQYLAALEKTRGYRNAGDDLVLVGDSGPVARFRRN
jgi:heat shock protein HslJ